MNEPVKRGADPITVRLMGGLGNQLFHPKYLSPYKDHLFFMAEDYNLCTFEKHHKLKILLFLYLSTIISRYLGYYML